MRYIWLKKIGRRRCPATRRCPNAASATMPLPTEAREGCPLAGPSPRRRTWRRHMKHATQQESNGKAAEQHFQKARTPSLRLIALTLNVTLTVQTGCQSGIANTLVRARTPNHQTTTRQHPAHARRLSGLLWFALRPAPPLVRPCNPWQDGPARRT